METFYTHFAAMEVITLVTFFEKEVLSILGNGLRFSTFLSNLIINDPFTKDSSLVVNIQLILIDSETKNK